MSKRPHAVCALGFVSKDPTREVDEAIRDKVPYFYKDHDAHLEMCHVAYHDGLFVYLARSASRVGAIQKDWPETETHYDQVGRMGPLSESEINAFKEVLNEIEWDVNYSEVVKSHVVLSME